jgi:choline-sulfatase
MTRPRADVATRAARHRALLAALLLGAMVACAGRHGAAPEGLLIITLDTTRADRLSAYGYQSAATPAIDRLARGGVCFDRATSVAPLTLTAHTSLFTGLYPPHHGVRDNTDPPLAPAEASTLAEAFHAHGFRTAAFVGSMVLAAERGLSSGFDVYDDGRDRGAAPPRRRPGSNVVDRADAWIDRLAGRSFFLWVHLYDVHAPQTPTAPGGPRTGDAYEDAITYVDAQIGRLLETLDRDHRLATTAIILAGDHGESLGEHGEWEHGIFLYEGALHIPLVVDVPGLNGVGRRVPEVASLVDIAPTIRELFRLPAAETDGVSLVPALRGAALPRRVVYAESMYARRFGWSPLRMVRDERYKYIDAPRRELYDLDEDPFETRDISADRPSIVAAMRDKLLTFAERASNRPALGPSADARALAALGYIARAPAAPSVRPVDPKDHIQEYNAIRGGDWR